VDSGQSREEEENLCFILPRVLCPPIIAPFSPTEAMMKEVIITLGIVQNQLYEFSGVISENFVNEGFFISFCCEFDPIGALFLHWIFVSVPAEN
jgi:hypothetical protein